MIKVNTMKTFLWRKCEIDKVFISDDKSSRTKPKQTSVILFMIYDITGVMVKIWNLLSKKSYTIV